MRLIEMAQFAFGCFTFLHFLATLASAKPSYIARLPNVPLDWPAVGHANPTSNGPLNPFGRDFKNAGKLWTVSLCKIDSDNDGLTNGYELGDPHCIWKPGDIPERTTDITNPGIPNKPRTFQPTLIVTAVPVTNNPTQMATSPSMSPSTSSTSPQSTPTSSPTSVLRSTSPTPSPSTVMPSPTDVTLQPTMLINAPSLSPTVQENSFVPTISPIVETSTPSSPANDNTYFLPLWVIMHAILGGLGFGLFMPCGNYFSSFGRKHFGEWKKLHITFGVLGLGCVSVAFALGWFSSESDELSQHGWFSVAGLILILLQATSGTAKYYRLAQILGIWHVSLRIATIPISIGVLISGYALLVDVFYTESPRTLNWVVYLCLSACILFWIAHSWLNFTKWRRQVLIQQRKRRQVVDDESRRVANLPTTSNSDVVCSSGVEPLISINSADVSEDTACLLDVEDGSVVRKIAVVVDNNSIEDDSYLALQNS